MQFQKIKTYLKPFKNKYIFTATLFVLYILFFDQNDLISQWKWRHELRKLETNRQYYLEEIRQTQKDLDELFNDNEKLEKFAREKYYMKNPDEEIFVFVEE